MKTFLFLPALVWALFSISLIIYLKVRGIASLVKLNNKFIFQYDITSWAYPFFLSGWGSGRFKTLFIFAPLILIYIYFAGKKK